MVAIGSNLNGEREKMHRLRGFDYKRSFFYMVTLKRLPEQAAFSQISDEVEPPKDAVSKVIWYNFKRGQPDET